MCPKLVQKWCGVEGGKTDGLNLIQIYDICVCVCGGGGSQTPELPEYFYTKIFQIQTLIFKTMFCPIDQLALALSLYGKDGQTPIGSISITALRKWALPPTDGIMEVQIRVGALPFKS